MSSAPSNNLQRLQQRLGYEFKNVDLLQLALTHKSFGRNNNERLEFLGDAVLGFVVADLLHADARGWRENDMSLIRADLVRGSSLADMARALDLGQHIRVASGELKSGGRRRDSILADAFEAVIGAIHEDGGIQPCTRVITELFGAKVVAAQAQGLKDPKTLLQEYLQGRGMELPVYEVVRVEGADHSREYTVSCRINDTDLAGEGSATSRRAAEKEAAALVLQLLPLGGDEKELKS